MAERDAGSDELDEAVAGFLALALVGVGREREAVALALGALAPHPGALCPAARRGGPGSGTDAADNGAYTSSSRQKRKGQPSPLAPRPQRIANQPEHRVTHQVKPRRNASVKLAVVVLGGLLPGSMPVIRD